jgi:hypothetical protein
VALDLMIKISKVLLLTPLGEGTGIEKSAANSADEGKDPDGWHLLAAKRRSQ